MSDSEDSSQHRGKMLAISIPKDIDMLCIEASMDKYSVDGEDDHHHAMIQPYTTEGLDTIFEEFKQWLGLKSP